MRQIKLKMTLKSHTTCMYIAVDKNIDKKLTVGNILAFSQFILQFLRIRNFTSIYKYIDPTVLLFAPLNFRVVNTWRKMQQPNTSSEYFPQ